MAIFTQKSNINAQQLVAGTSRYVNSEAIYWGDIPVITFTTYKKKEVPIQNNDQITTIRAGEEYRPDTTSKRFYGTPDFWWRILEANNMFDIFEYKSGVSIRIPLNL